MVLHYDNNFAHFLGKFKIQWIGPYIIKEIREGGSVRFTTLNGEFIHVYANGSRLKPYRDELILVRTK